MPPGTRIEVPAGFAIFANEFVSAGRPPRELAERTYQVTRWSELPPGGYFPALEEPEMLAGEIRAFFRPLRGSKPEGSQKTSTPRPRSSGNNCHRE